MTVLNEGGGFRIGNVAHGAAPFLDVFKRETVLLEHVLRGNSGRGAFFGGQQADFRLGAGNIRNGGVGGILTHKKEAHGHGRHIHHDFYILHGLTVGKHAFGLEAFFIQLDHACAKISLARIDLQQVFHRAASVDAHGSVRHDRTCRLADNAAKGVKIAAKRARGNGKRFQLRRLGHLGQPSRQHDHGNQQRNQTLFHSILLCTVYPGL